MELLGLITLIGALALWYLPEMLLGNISNETDGTLAHLVAVDDDQYSGRIVGNPRVMTSMGKHAAKGELPDRGPPHQPAGESVGTLPRIGRERRRDTRPTDD